MHNIDNLKKTIDQAEQAVKIGGLYAHYRKPERLYKVLAIAINENTEEPCVVYQALYGDKLIWVRALSAWREQVEHQGNTILRFIPKE